MVKIFDSHTHLNDTPFAGQEALFVERAAALGVVKMAIVGSNPTLNEGALKLARDFPNLYAVIGWHPEDAKNFDAAAEATLRQQLREPKVVAVGEIGLDYHWDSSPRDVQRQVFAKQLQIAKAFDLPVSIHSRDALEDTYEILQAAQMPAGRIILHSFNATPDWAPKFLDLGAYLSFSGVITFKKAAYLRETVKQAPLDKLLVETDAPYLAPMPYRGRQNEPGYTYYTVRQIATTLGLPVATIAAQTYRNTLKVFGLEADK
ncbi:TatD family hydrolase [Lapidilactobacillus wuchangensis]|uniref:TatD family hydrolase n=1 Tax=Lapidilactobacillus wuchangensis TaxID=2486001 RepID=UPI000F79B6E6|nr:TatD family hydrolase [Lapidilactobacillus wuchangensis]